MTGVANVFDYTVVECNYESDLFEWGQKLIWPNDLYIPEGWVKVPTDVAYKFMEEFNKQ